MTVTFYKYSGDDTVANKLHGLTLVYQTSDAAAVNYTTYGGFDPVTPSFALDALYDVNLVKYDYNGHDYIASLDAPVTGADGLYVYTGRVDALATAWANGCFNVSEPVAYSDLGSNHYIIDSRLPWKLGKETDDTLGVTFTGTGTMSEYFVVRTIDIAGGALGNNPFTYYTWVITRAEFHSLLDKLKSESDTNREAVYRCVIDARYIHNLSQNYVNALPVGAFGVRAADGTEIAYGDLQFHYLTGDTT